MTRRAKIGWSIFALLVFTCLWLAWDGRRERPSINVVYDRSIYFLTGEDPVTRCWKREREGQAEWDAFIGARRCYAFAPPRIYDGVFVDEFEGQRFVPDDWPDGRRYSAPDIWFEMDEKSDLRVEPLVGIGDTKMADDRSRLWRVRFVGRETARPGHYGHLGVSRRMILVDRLLIAKPIAIYDGYLPDNLDPRTLNSGNRR